MIDKRWCMASACGAALMSAAAAQAQTAAPQDAASTVAEVVVTANKRSENLMDVPVAVTAFTSQAIADKRLAVLSDLNNAAPNVRISGGDAAANPKMFIRGVGLSDFNPTTASAVGVYVDGVYIGSPFATLSSFFDLGQIEVLRGPQGTLYGKNTTGGAISITSNRPTWRPSAEGSVEYGRFKALTVNGAVSGPLIEDKLAFRLAGQYLRDDGATLNTVTGDHVNNANRGAIRGSLLFTPSDKDEALLSATRYANRGGARQAKQRPLFPSTAAATGSDGLCKPGFYYSGACTDISGYADPSADPYRVAADVQGKDRVDYYSTSLNYTHHFGGVDLVSVSAFQNVRRNIDENSDVSPADILHNNFIAYQKEWSQELRLQADVGKLKWVLGAYYMRDELKNNSTFDVLRDFRPFFTSPSNPTGVSVDNSVVFLRYAYTQNTDTYALFGQADYSLTDKLTATVGLRYSADKKTFDYHETAEEAFDLVPPYAQRKTFGAFSGRLGLRYDLTDQANIYATYNRGFKSGGFFGGQADHESYAEQLAPYGNETVDAYEVGSKSSLFDRRLRLSLSAFYYDYKDLQAFAFVVRGARTVQILDNAGSAQVYGGEAEITAVPIRNLTLTGGLALLHAKYKDYKSEGGDYSGNQMPEAPRFNASLSAKYKVELASGASIEPSLDASYRTRIFFDPSQTERLSSPAVFQLNGQLAWRSPDEHFEAGLWAKNLTNKAVLVEISPIAGLGYDMLSYAPPRTFGVFLRYHY